MHEKEKQWVRSNGTETLPTSATSRFTGHMFRKDLLGLMCFLMILVLHLMSEFQSSFLSTSPLAKIKSEFAASMAVSEPWDDEALVDENTIAQIKADFAASLAKTELTDDLAVGNEGDASSSVEEEEQQPTDGYDPFSTPTLRNMTGSWMANLWVPPPPWRYFSVAEIRELYKDIHILWVGDSTARRTGMTLFNLIRSSNESIHLSSTEASRDIDLGKRWMACARWVDLRHRPDVCPLSPSGTGEVATIKRNCYTEIEGFFGDELSGVSNITKDFQLIVIAAGIHEVLRYRTCHDPNRGYDTQVVDLVRLLDEFQRKTGKFVIVRTSGHNDVDLPLLQKVAGMNSVLMDAMDQNSELYQGTDRITHNLTYVNWGGAVEARSLPPDRIMGDIGAHYGNEPRIVMVQQMTNLLYDRGYFKNFLP